MVAQTQLLLALAAGALAGLLFLLLGRWLMARDSQAAPDVPAEQAPALQARPAVTQDNLSPEAQAFIKALQGHTEAPKKPSVDPVWAVDIWDARQSPGGTRGLPH
jgi:hypothetical protein